MPSIRRRPTVKFEERVKLEEGETASVDLDGILQAIGETVTFQRDPSFTGVRGLEMGKQYKVKDVKKRINFGEVNGLLVGIDIGYGSVRYFGHDWFIKDY